jgi:hypothetical protein
VLFPNYFAQQKKKSGQQKPSHSQFDPSFSSDKLLNDSLKKSKWHFDLKEFDNSQILLTKDKMKPDVLCFVDDKNFQINVNQKNCKSTIKGTYQIMKETKGIAVTLGKCPFKVTYTTNQKCIDRLVFFLERNLEVFFDEEESVIEIK